MKKTLLKLGIAISPLLFLLVGVSKVQAEAYGWSPNVDNSWQGPPKCTDAKPDKAPILLQPNHPVLPKRPKGGEVVLYWHKVPGASGYNIYYGLSKKNYIYTAPNLGDTDNFTVGYLANRLYYFAVQAKKGCAASALSNEWAVRPGRGGFVSLAAPGVKPVKKTTPSPPKKTTTVTLPTPTSAPAVKGITAEPTEVIYQPPVAVPTPTPKPKSFWQTILSLFGLGR